jgi:hypothetical protein
MAGYVWRVPALLGVMACAAVLLFAVKALAAILLRRRSSTLRLIAAAATLGVVTLLSFFALRATAIAIARDLEVSVALVEPGRLAYLAPLLFAAFLWSVGRWVLGSSWTSRSALLYYAWVLIFTAANTIDRCSPGWCTTIGFPFPWQTWSDVLFDAGGFRQVMDAVGSALDLLVFMGVAVVITRARPRVSIRDTAFPN